MDEIRGILRRTTGVIDIEMDPYKNTVTVTYDETQTDLATITKNMSDGGFPPLGQPKFLK
jgi:copper chaperone CopZ